MPLSTDDFKGFFNRSKRKDVEKYNRRELKVDEALTEMMQQVGEIEKLGGNAKRFHAVYKKLSAEVQNAETLGAKDPAGAYKKLKKIKETAREQLENAKRELHDQQFAGDTKTNVKGVDHPIQLHPQSMPGVDKLSQTDRKEVVKKISEKMAKGKELLDKIGALEDDELDQLTAPNRKDVADLMWYIKAMAEEKAGEAFAKGAMTIPDPGNKIRKYLDKCNQVYGRDSSHLKEEQPGELSQARGIDFYEGNANGEIADIDLLLPYGMNTVLTQTIRSKNGTELLYVKMETESARVNPTYKQAEDTPDSREWKSEDIGRAVKHLINLLKSHEDGTLSSFREQTPQAIGQAYAKVIAVAKKNKSTEAAAVLKEGWSAAKKKGISRKKDFGNTVRINGIIANFEAVKKLALAGKVDQVTMAALFECENKIVEAYGDEGNTERFGGEILLNKDDLSGKKLKTTPGQDMEEELRGETEVALSDLDEAEEEEAEEDDDDMDDRIFDIIGAATDPSLFVPTFEDLGKELGIDEDDIELINGVVVALHGSNKVDPSTLSENDAKLAGAQRRQALAAACKIRPIMLARPIVKLLQ